MLEKKAFFALCVESLRTNNIFMLYDYDYTCACQIYTVIH